MDRTSPSSHPAQIAPPGQWRTVGRPALVALLVGAAALVAGLMAESAIIRITHGNRQELEWLSDAVISVAAAGLAYLWLHLRSLRMRVLALEREQIALDEQLRLAAEIQRKLLPAVPPRTPGFRWAAQMVPAGHIGGDFYDFIQVADETVLAIVCDVSGKGIPAALILSELKTLFRTLVRDTVDPAEIAERMSAALHEEHAGLPFATGIVARFEASPPRLAYVNAGHPAGYVLRGEGARVTLEAGGPPLGLFPGLTYGTATVELVPGDIGALVTDGIAEALEDGPVTLAQALDASRERFGVRQSPAAICDHLLEVAAQGTGPEGVAGWQDDRTVLAFSVEPAP